MYDPRDPEGLIESWCESPEPTLSKASERKPKTPYRGLPDRLIHDPSFQALTPNAKLLYFVLRLLLRRSGIDVCYPALLLSLTGLSQEEITEATVQLEHEGWLLIEGNIFWLINALRDDPTSFTLNNPNHRKSIQKHIGSLQPQPIVNRFADHYMLDPPFPEVDESPHPRSHRGPIPDQEKGDRRKDIGEIGISGE